MEASLHRAVRRCDVVALQDILSSGLDVCATFTHEPPLISLLQQVVQENFADGVALVLQATSPEAPPDCGSAVRKTFSYAVRHERYDVIRVFLLCALEGSCGCFVMSPNDVFKHAMQAMLYDVASKALEKDQFEYNSKMSVAVEPPLHAAVRHDQACLVRALLRRGAVVDVVNTRGMTALVGACAVPSFDCCVMLLGHGADVRHAAYRDVNKSPMYALLIASALPGTPQRCAERAVSIRSIVRFLLSAGMIVFTEQLDLILSCGSMPLISIDLLNWLKSLRYNPASLELACHCVIRRRLVELTGGTSLVQAVDRLPIPSHIKMMLTFDQLLMPP